MQDNSNISGINSNCIPEILKELNELYSGFIDNMQRNTDAFGCLFFISLFANGRCTGDPTKKTVFGHYYKQLIEKLNDNSNDETLKKYPIPYNRLFKAMNNYIELYSKRKTEFEAFDFNKYNASKKDESFMLINYAGIVDSCSRYTLNNFESIYQKKNNYIISEHSINKLYDFLGKQLGDDVETWKSRFIENDNTIDKSFPNIEVQAKPKSKKRLLAAVLGLIDDKNKAQGFLKMDFDTFALKKFGLKSFRQNYKANYYSNVSDRHSDWKEIEKMI